MKKKFVNLVKQKAWATLFVFGCLYNQLSADSSEYIENKQTKVAPINLISPKRPDVMAKYIYAKHREWGVASAFGSSIYYRHLQVWNNFWEYDPPKGCFEDFNDAFHAILDSIKNEGFKCGSEGIHIGSNGILCNGSHRLTACLLYNKDVSIKRMPYECCAWGLEYFKNRGLEEKYLDAMALQYCELQPKSFVMVIFPSAQERDREIKEIIKRYATIVYKKHIQMTVNGGFNLVLTAYENEPFVKEGKFDNYSTAAVKARSCFPVLLTEKNPLQVYLLESVSLKHIKACKNEIRALFGIGHDSVHATDSHAEAVVMARTLFNKNSIACLNKSIKSSTPLFDAYFEKYRQWLAASPINEEWFCVDSGAVLAAYGLRDCSDLDFLHHGESPIYTDIAGIDDHNLQISHHAASLDDIIFDPDNYFYYHGVKFCSLDLIKKMKLNRNEAKDVVDVGLINQIL